MELDKKDTQLKKIINTEYCYLLFHTFILTRELKAIQVYKVNNIFKRLLDPGNINTKGKQISNIIIYLIIYEEKYFQFMYLKIMSLIFINKNIFYFCD